MKQISDQDVARGKAPLAYEGYMELLLSACSNYDKKVTLPGKQKRAVYSTTTSNDDDNYQVDNDLKGEYEVFKVDTDVSDILVHSSNSTYLSNKPKTFPGSEKNKSSFLPRDEWNKLTQDQKDKLIAKRRQEKSGNVPYASTHRVNIHEIEEMVNLDDIVEYTTMMLSMTSKTMQMAMIIPYSRTWPIVVLTQLMEISGTCWQLRVLRSRRKPLSR